MTRSISAVLAALAAAVGRGGPAVATSPCPRCGVSATAGAISCAFCGTAVAEPRDTTLGRLRDRGALEIAVLAVVTLVVAVTWTLVLLHR